MSSKLVWDGKSRKGDAVIEDSDRYVSDLHLTTCVLYDKTFIEIERLDEGVTLDKGDAIEMVKYLTAIIPTMKGTV